MFFAGIDYNIGHCIFSQSDYLELILDNDSLFNSIFEEKPYEFEVSNYDKRRKQVQSITYYSINPIVNNCLRHSLKNLDKYKERAVAILKFGINYNRKIAANINFSNCYIFDELGALKNYKDEDYYQLIIFTDAETNDEDINALISQLPKFNKYQLGRIL